MSTESNNCRLRVGDLWIERVAQRSGFVRLGERLHLSWIARRVTGNADAGPLLLIFTVICFHLPILSAIGYLETGVFSFARNPGEAFQIPAWVIVVAILLRLKQSYEETINELPGAKDEDISDIVDTGTTFQQVFTALGIPPDADSKATANLESITAERLKYGLLVAGLAFYFAFLLFDPGLSDTVASLTGEAVAFVRFYIIIPFVLYPIGAEIIAVCLGCLVLLPFKIRRAGLIDFSDPRGFADLDSTGRLFKTVTVHYLVLIAMFATFLTVGRGASPNNLFTSSLLVSGLLIGVLLFVLPIYWMSRYISRAKEVKIDAIAKQAKAIGDTNDIFPYATPESVQETNDYTYQFIALNRVQDTNEYPLNLSMIQDLLFALILPYLTTVAFQFLFDAVL